MISFWISVVPPKIYTVGQVTRAWYMTPMGLLKKLTSGLFIDGSVGWLWLPAVSHPPLGFA